MRFRCLQSLCATLMFVASLGAGPSRANDARQIALEGDIHYRDSQFSEAREAYSRALAVDPRNAKALNNRALTFLQLGDLAAAVEDLSRALDAAPSNGTIWNNRANVNCTMKRVQESVADRIQALYRGRFTAAEAQGGLRRTGFYNGPSDGIWGYDSEQALLAWTWAGCPRPPKSRLL